MKSFKGKRILAFIMSAVLAFATFANDASLLTATAEGLDPARDVKITYEFCVDGSVVETQVLNDGDTLYAPAAPVKDAEVFLGWYAGETKFEGFGVVTIPETVTEDTTVTLNARFASETVHVYYHDILDRVVFTGNADKNSTYTVEAVSVEVNADQRLAGWSTVSGSSDAVSSVAVGESDVNLYPVVKNVFWITFDTDGGSVLSPVYSYDGTLPELPVPEKAGYTFNCWTLNGNKVPDNYTVTGDVEFKASWTAAKNVEYKIVYMTENANDDGYSFHSQSTMTGEAGTSSNVKAKRIEGFTSQTVTQEIIKGDGTTIVYVYYKRNTAKIELYTYKSGRNGGWKVAVTIEAKQGQIIKDKWPTKNYPGLWGASYVDDEADGPFIKFLEVMPSTNAKYYYNNNSGDRYFFMNYYVEGLDGKDQFLFTSEWRDSSYVGSWPFYEENEYEVTAEDRIELQGFVCDTDRSAKVGDTISYSSKAGSRENVPGATSFYYKRSSYSVSFFNGNTDTKETVKYGEPLDLLGTVPARPSSIPEGYAFKGWYTNKECLGTPYVFTGKTMPAENLTFYAKWEAEEHNVSFVTLSGEAIDPQTIAYGSQASKPADPVREGYIFAGWTCNGEPFNFTAPIYKDTELVAKWIKNESLSVVYVSEFGEAPVDTAKYLEGNNLVVKAAPLGIPENKRFLGWSLGGFTVYPGNSLEMHDSLDGAEDGKVTLTAMFADPVEDTKIIYKSGAEDAGVAVSIVKNSRVDVLYHDNSALNFSKAGYVFTGWKDADGKDFAEGARVDSRNIAGNTLIAQWKMNSVIVTIYEDSTLTAVKYDGLEHKICGYTYSSSLIEYTANDFAYIGDESKLIVKGTNPGTYKMELVPEDFENRNTAYSDVQFVIVNGSLKIDKNDSSIVIKANDDGKSYDGTALTNPGIEEVAGLAKGDYVEATVTGSVTNVSDNQEGNNVVESYKIVNASGEDVTSFYSNVQTKNGTLTILPKDVTVSVESKEKTYGDENPTDFDITVSGAVTEEDRQEIENCVKVTCNAGNDVNSTYEIVVSVEGYSNANYNVIPKNGVLTVVPRHISIKADDITRNYGNTENIEFTYSVVEGSLVEGDSVEAVLSCDYTEDAGEYSITFPEEKNNSNQGKYIIDGFIPGTLTILATDQIVLTPKNYSGEYDGQYHTGSVEASMDGVTIEYSLDKEDWVSEIPEFKDVVSQTVYARGSRKNYVPSETVSFTVDITKRTISLESGSGSFEYDKEAHKVETVNYDSSRVLPGEEFTFDNFASVTNVYEGEVPNVFDVIFPEGVNAENYEFDTIYGTLEVTPHTITITSGDYKKRYDGKTHTKTTITYTGKRAGIDEITAKTTGVSVTHVSEGRKTNDITYTLTGDERNYNIVLKPGVLQIYPFDTFIGIFVFGNGLVTDYTGEEQSVEGYTLMIAPDMDEKAFELYDLEKNVSFSGEAKASGTEAGTYRMNLNTNQFSNNNSDFSNVAFGIYVDGYLVINREVINLPEADFEKIYDGQGCYRELYKDIDGESYTFVFASDETEVGTHILTYKGMKKTGTDTFITDSKYDIQPDLVTDTIKKRPITIQALGAKKYYDDEPLTAGWELVEEKGTLVEGHRLEVKTDGFQVMPGYTSNAVVSAEVYEGNRRVTDNYQINTEVGLLVVERKLITVTPNDLDKTYGEDDPELTATISPYEEDLEYTLSREQGEEAGTYVIKAEGDRYQGYVEVKFEEGTFTIHPATDNYITVYDYCEPYDGKSHGVAAKSTEGTVLSYSVNGGEFTSEVPTITNVGKMEITVKGVNPNYDPEEIFKTYTLEVTALPVTVTADNKKTTYGAPSEELTATVKGTLEGEEILINKGTLVCNLGDNTVGKYPITFENTEEVQGNYVVTYVPGEYEIIPVGEEIIITADSASKMYDGTALTRNAYTLNRDDVLLEGDVLEVDIEGTITDVGTADNKVTGYRVLREETDVTDCYTFGASKTGTLEVTKRDVKLTSASDSKAYDGTELANHNVQVGGSGFVNGEGATYNVTGSIVAVGSTKNGFTYSLNEGTKAGNYDITIEEGTLEITPMTTEVVVNIKGNDGIYTYDGLSHELSGYTVESISNNLYSEFFFEADDSVKVSETNAGTYPLGLTSKNFVNTNRNFSNVVFNVVDGTLEIGKREIEITAKSGSKRYDGTPVSAGYEITKGSLAAGQIEKVVVTGEQTNVGESDNVITSVAIFAGDVDVTANYDIKTVNGKLSVDYKLVSVIPDEISKHYGEEDPALTALVSPEASVSYTLTREAGENVGAYKITAAGERYQGNYNVTFGTGRFIILQATDNYINVTGYKGEYDGKAHGVAASSTDGTVLTYSVNGGEFTSEVPTITNVGKMEVTVKGVNPNYYPEEIKKTYTLEVTALNVTVTADNKKTVYGAPSEELTATVKGTLAGEESLINIGTLVCNKDDKVGKYPITFTDTQKTQGNYIVTYVDGIYEIIPIAKELIIAAGSASKMYDGTALTCDEFTLNDDSIILASDRLAVEIEGTITDAGEIENTVIGYKVLRGETDVTDGYVFGTSVDGKLTVTKRDVILTSETASKVYDGEPLTAGNVTVSGSGFVSGEGAAYEVTGTITEAGNVSNTFTYTLNEGTKASNYNISKVEGTLTITPVTEEVVVKIAGNNDSFTYDGEEHILTGYTVVSVSNSLYKESDVSLKRNVKAVEKNAGTYSLGLSSDDFVNNSANFDNVKFEVTDGVLYIGKRTVTVRPYNSSKIEGDADPTLYGAVENAVSGDPVIAYFWRIAGADKELPGTYPIYVTIAGGVDSYPNYVINILGGTFTVTAKNAPIVIPEVPPTIPEENPPVIIEVEETPLTEEPEIIEEPVEEPVEEPAEEPVVVVEEEKVPEVDKNVTEIDEEVPLASHGDNCWIHWIILLTTLLEAVYFVMRAIKNKKELDDIQKKEAEK